MTIFQVRLSEAPSKSNTHLVIGIHVNLVFMSHRGCKLPLKAVSPEEEEEDVNVSMSNANSKKVVLYNFWNFQDNNKFNVQSNKDKQQQSILDHLPRLAVLRLTFTP